MITLVCMTCSHALRVIGDDRETHQLVGQQCAQWPDKFKCYNCGAQAQGMLSSEISEAAERALFVNEVTPQEAFAAINGMGIPKEHTCCAEVLVPMFEAAGIKVKGRELPHTNRYVIDQLTFADGRTVHLGASMMGALAYRITKKHSYVQAVEDTVNGA